ncbi:hypothetical protein EDB95_2498 [Dinghuibacter silviterrae]|uniref:AAA domain-containing protein n=2 Tax=Dinghuibacter silviterrae TaxID=1539049 RepID=A0A4R8DT46_9BACT|nr:hypothetical protein EDB95_2498 [Dinghuibacter silviterrae]
MEPLLAFQDVLLGSVENRFSRESVAKIRWNDKMIGIRGPRGAGKTTLILQRLKFGLGDQREKGLYVTADHTWFYTHSLLDTAMDWWKQGGRVLFIDEVHKYPHWSRELKNIYDGLPGMKVIFSASSALDIYRGEADLSRRVVSYSLPGLSFREYLQFTERGTFPAMSLDDIRAHHREVSRSVLEKVQPLPDFRHYLRQGYLPIFTEGEESYLPRLEQVINTTLEADLATLASYNAGTAARVKKLLGVIAESAPFKPNISALADKMGLHRDKIYEFIYQLEDARLLNLLSAEGKGVSRLQKPEKIYLENTNLAYAMQASPDMGNLRETFLMGQLVNAGLSVTAPTQGDFKVGDLFIEVGGKSKNAGQVKGEASYLVAADDIEMGVGSKVPLWMFGFLY